MKNKILNQLKPLGEVGYHYVMDTTKWIRDVLIIIVLTMFITSCGSSQCMYNVGTGNPMQQTCGGTGWFGGQ